MDIVGMPEPTGELSLPDELPLPDKPVDDPSVDDEFPGVEPGEPFDGEPPCPAPVGCGLLNDCAKVGVGEVPSGDTIPFATEPDDCRDVAPLPDPAVPEFSTPEPLR